MRGSVVGLGAFRSSYLQWEVRADTLTLQYLDKAVSIRLGDYFRSLSSIHFESASPDSAWLCFLSTNDVLLRMHFIVPQCHLLEPLVTAAAGKCLHLSTEFILSSHAFGSGGRRVEVQYASLDLLANQIISCSSWTSHADLLVGFSSGDALLVRLDSADASSPVRKSILTVHRAVDSLLTSFGLGSKVALGAVLAIELLPSSGAVLILTQDGSLALWDPRSLACLSRLDLPSALALDQRRTSDRMRLQRVFISAAHVSDGEEGAVVAVTGDDARWHMVCVSVTGGVLEVCASLPPPSSDATLVDIVALHDSLLTLWACPMRSRIFSYSLGGEACPLELAPELDARLELLLAEDALHTHVADTSHALATTLLRRVFVADRFSVPVIAHALSEGVPLELQRSVDHESDVGEDLIACVAEVCSDWADLIVSGGELSHANALVLSYSGFIGACHHRASELRQRGRGCLQYAPSHACREVAFASADGLVRVSLDDALARSWAEEAADSAEAVIGAAALRQCCFLVTQTVQTDLTLDRLLSDVAVAYASLDARSQRSLREACAAEGAVGLTLLAQFSLGSVQAFLASGDEQSPLGKTLSLAGSLEGAAGALALRAFTCRKQRRCAAVCLLLLALADDATLLPAASAQLTCECLPLAAVALAHCCFLRWLDELYLPSDSCIDPSLARLRCFRPALDARLSARKVSPFATLGSAPTGLWTALTGYLLDRADSPLVWGRTGEALLEAMLGPSCASDLSLFLEARGLNTCLRVRTAIQLLLSAVSADAPRRSSFLLRSIIGGCQLALLRDEAIAEGRSAAELLLSAPSSQPWALSSSALEDSLNACVPLNCRTIHEYLERVECSSFAVYALELSHVAKHQGAFAPLLHRMSLQELAASFPELCCAMERVVHVQQCLEFLRRVHGPATRGSLLLAAHRLVLAIDEALSALRASELLDEFKSCEASLSEDLRSVWIFIFEDRLSCGSFGAALSALLRVWSMSGFEESNLSVLVAEACVRGHLDWLCDLPETYSSVISAQLERLHLRRDSPDSCLFFDCLCAYYMRRDCVHEAARVAVSFAERCAVEDAGSASRLRALVVVNVCLASLPATQRYSVTRLPSTSSTRKRLLHPADVSDGASAAALSFVSHSTTTLALAEESMLRLLRDRGVASVAAYGAETAVVNLVRCGLASEALYLVRMEHASLSESALANIFRELGNSSMHSSLQFDLPYRRHAGTLSHNSTTEELQLAQLSAPLLSVAAAMIPFSEGELLSLQRDADVVLRALLKRNDLVAACKVAVDCLGSDGTWVSYSDMDRLILRCREALNAHEVAHPQLEMCLAALTHSLTMHFAALITA